MQILRVLHLSDLHISGKYSIRRQHLGGGNCNYNALKGVARFIFEKHDDKKSRPITAILISGDIADIGGYLRDIDIARSFFYLPNNPSSKKPWLDVENKPTLKFFPKPIILMPGNHDRYRGSWGKPGASLFDNYFQDFWNAGVGGVQSYLLPNEKLPSLAIICADFSLAKKTDRTARWGHYGQGRVYENISSKEGEHNGDYQCIVLHKLELETKKMFSLYPSCPVIWMIHFAPKFEDEERLKQRERLVGADYLIAKAEELGVRDIFCGHTHKKHNYKTGSTKQVRVHCAGTSTCKKSRLPLITKSVIPRIHVRDIHLENDKVGVKRIKTRDYYWNGRIFTKEKRKIGKP